MLARFRPLGRRLTTTAVLLAALALGACQTNGGGNKPVAATALSSGNKTIAFESIDGPPEPVFNRLVADLSDQAKARQMPVVSRGSQAAYRVRGYLAATVANGKGEVDWVWDVFDADSDRVLRVAGREKVGPGKDVWNNLDDATVQRIAAQSLAEISTRLAGGTPATSSTTPAAAPALGPADAPPVNPGDGPVVASAVPDDIPADVVTAPSATEGASSALTFASHP